MSDYNYIDMVRLCNTVAWEIADRRKKKMRLIDADSLKYRRANYGGYDDVGEEERKRGILFLLKEDIAAAPTIDPVKHGKWILFDGRYYCSECDEDMDWKTYYCPNCGAKMDLEEQDDDT